MIAAEMKTQLDKMRKQVEGIEQEEASRSVLSWGRYYLPHFYYRETQSDLHYHLNYHLTNLEPTTAVGPREWSKSTLSTISAPLFHALENPDKVRSILICSSDPTLSAGFVRQIREEIEVNQAIKDKYGNQVGWPWRERHIRTAGGVNIRAGRTCRPVRGIMDKGERPDMVILDDAEIERDVRTHNARKNVNTWYKASVLPSIAKNAPIFHVGTLLHWQSLIGQKIKSGEGKIFRALEDGKSTWPEHRTTEELLRQLASMGELFFNQEMMGVPSEGGILADFLSNLAVSKFSTTELRKFPEKWVGVDLAKSLTDQADYTAFSKLGFIKGPKGEEVHVIDLHMERIEIPRQVEALIDWIGEDIHLIDGIVVEDIGYQEAFAYALEEELDKRRLTKVEVCRYTPLRSKLSRLYGLLKRAGGGGLHIGNIPLRTTCIRQLINIEDDAENDDLVDAIDIIVAYQAATHLRMRLTK